MSKRVVVIGGGFGGLQAAKSLAGADVELTLVDRENHHLFQPLLYQVATAGLAPGSIATPIRAVLADQDNARVVLGEAQSLDPDESTLTLADGEVLPYDTLVIAVGTKTNYFGHEDDWALHAHGLKDIRDAIGIRERILSTFEAAERIEDEEQRRRLMTFVVVGGGPTGVEMAGAISELARQVLAGDYRRVAPRDIRVLLVEMDDRVLTPFAEYLSHSAERQLRELGVELRLGTRVTDVREGEIDLDGETLQASVVVWATGVEPVPFAIESGLTSDSQGYLVVDEHCAAIGRPNIFVIGDAARFMPQGEDDPLPGLAPVAMQQGRFVAEQIKRDLKRRARGTFKYKDKGIMATVGRSRAVVQGAVELQGHIAWLAWCFIHVLYLIGFRNRFIVVFNWIWSYVSFKRGARLITGRRDLGHSRPHTQVAQRASPTDAQNGIVESPRPS